MERVVDGAKHMVKMEKTNFLRIFGSENDRRRTMTSNNAPSV